jgi:hypothetical protein
MSASIRELMTELYDIQQAIINANAPNAPNQAAQFKKIRDHLSLYWDNIVVALRQCNSFALDVERLQQNVQRMDNKHLIGFLDDLVGDCERCKKLAEGLVPLHDASVRQYSIHEEEYRRILRNAVRSKGNRQKQKKNGNQPNGEWAMIKFTTACDSLRREVVNMGIFFGGQVLACKDYLSAAKGRRRQIPQEEAKQFANRWKEYRESTIKAITEIQKIGDAVVVAAVGNAHPKKSSCMIV